MKNKKLKIVDVLVFIELFLLILSITLSKEVTNLDELWHYNIARQISFGLIPYKEISLITTPIFPTFISIFLKGIFDQLIVYRIICSILVTCIFFLSYKVLIKTTKNTCISITITNLLLLIMKEHLLMEYNMFVIFLTLIIILIEISDKENIKIEDKQNISNANKFDKKVNNFKRNFWIGFVAGLAFLTKQTIGAFIILGILFFKIIEIIITKIQNKDFINNQKNIEDKEKYYISFKIKNKNLLKELLARFLGVLITLIVFLIYLTITKSFNDFVSYCFLGIKTFSNKISYKNLLKSSDILIKILSNVMPITLIIEFIISCFMILKNKNIKTLIIFYYSIFLILIEYPISDNEHFLKANFILILATSVFIFDGIELILNKRKINEKIKQTILSLSLSITVYFSIFYAGNYMLTYFKEDKSNDLKHYKYLAVPEYIIDTTNKIAEFIEKNNEKNIYILDSNAVVYDIALDRYFKNYDMFNVGNFGKDSTNGIISNIKNSNNCFYLIRKREINLNWQTPKDVIEYIRSNLQKNGELDLYEIYYK